MKIFTNILQFLLAVWVIIGGVFMMGHHTSLASVWAAQSLPPVFWTILGVVQICLAAVLILSLMVNALRKYVVMSATLLAIIVLSGIFLYSAYAGLTGMLWALIPAGLFAFVAYKRKTQVS